MRARAGRGAATKARLEVAPALLRAVAGAAAVASILAGLWGSGLLQPRQTQLVEVLDVSQVLTAPVAPLPATGNAGPAVGLNRGNLAPDFEFSDYSGRRVRLSDFRGRPVVVNFWASWCTACEVEIPALARALDAHREIELAVIAVNNGETYRKGRGFLDQHGADLTAVAFDPVSRIAGVYGVAGLPATFFIDRDGIITGVTIGPLTDAALTEALDMAAGPAPSGSRSAR
jgi:peroxiredoxin